MGLSATNAQYFSIIIVVLELVLKAVALYAMFVAIKAFKVYTKRNS
jgi:hypothetical protein